MFARVVRQRLSSNVGLMAGFVLLVRLKAAKIHVGCQMSRSMVLLDFDCSKLSVIQTQYSSVVKWGSRTWPLVSSQKKPYT
jgi:hypothetical protein